MGVSRLTQSIIGVGAALVLAASAVAGAPKSHQIDLNELMNETQIMSNDPNRMAMAWWIPAEFWQASMGADPTVTPDEIKQVVDSLGRYTVIGALDGTMGPFGGVDYRTKSQVRSTLQLKDVNGHVHRPLGDNQVDQDAQNLLDMMKPVLANILGPMGENLHFFVFPATDEKNEPIIQPRKRGTFSVVLDDEALHYRLPLGSILPPHKCPSCKDKLSGAFSFCPWDGASLTGHAGANTSSPAQTATVTEETGAE